jgi:CRISPR-associated protein Cas5h
MIESELEAEETEKKVKLKLIVFDVSSFFALFRKNFSTTYALTFAVIPRSAVEGLIGSIIGLSRFDFPNLLESSKIAIQLMSPVRKLNMKYMHINHDWWNETLNHYLKNTQFVLQKTRAQMAVPASVELLVKPSYRLYVDTNNEQINNDLATNLRNKQSFYTPYLGGTSMIASAKYVGEFDYEPAPNNGEYLPVSSIIPFIGRMPKIKLERDLSFATEEDIAIHIDNGRRSIGTYSVLYSVKPGCLLVTNRDIVKVENNTYVKFLPTKARVST